MGKHFISFLGTGAYQECIYSYGDKIGKKVVYIQDAFIDFFCGDFDKDDKITIFLTAQAKAKHWNSLCEAIKSKKLRCILNPVDIIDSNTEADIWGLFEQIYNEIGIKDEIFFDLTHSFRYLPMLFFSILNYATYLKEIVVKGIYYGAWEARNPESNVAPVFDLTQAYELMQWANAADVFTNYGITDKLAKCVKGTAREYLGTSGLIKQIEAISKNISCSRSIAILKGSLFSEVEKKIHDLPDSNVQPAFKPILKKVQDKISGFDKDTALNFIPAVEWCVAHKMIPQGITMLQEGIISFVIDRHGFNYTDRELRMALSSYFHKNEKGNFVEHESHSKYKEELEKIFNDSLVNDLAPIYQSITPTRNDINHGGTNESSSSSTDKLFDKLKKRFEEVKDVFRKHDLL